MHHLRYRLEHFFEGIFLFLLCRIALNLGKVLWRELSLLQELFDFGDSFEYPFLYPYLHLFLLGFVLHLHFETLLVVLHALDEPRDFLIKPCFGLIKRSIDLCLVTLYRSDLPFELFDDELVFLNHVLTSQDYRGVFQKSFKKVSFFIFYCF